MAAKNLTVKQEAFCQKYIETGNATEAYRQAYNAGGMKPLTIACRARDELAKAHIAERVKALRGDLQVQHAVTVAGLIAELEEARRLAAQVGNPSAMVSATMGKAKLAGLDKAIDPDDDSAAPTSVTVTVVDARADA